jgi:hypothetical protein
MVDDWSHSHKANILMIFTPSPLSSPHLHMMRAVCVVGMCVRTLLVIRGQLEGWGKGVGLILYMWAHEEVISITHHFFLFLPSRAGAIAETRRDARKAREAKLKAREAREAREAEKKRSNIGKGGQR